MKNYITATDEQLRQIETVKKSYFDYPLSPKVIVNYPAGPPVSTKRMIESPEYMLKCQLDAIKNHLDVGDDYIPSVRVEFGTGQVAHAFGCDMYVPDDSPVCSKGQMLEKAEDVKNLEIPALDAGWFGKAYEFTKYFIDNKPDWVELEALDLQSPFNNANLIRGTDIFNDFYECPELLEELLEKTTIYQIELINHYRSITGMKNGYTYDWSMIWKGNARLSNCSLHMISTAHYNEFIKKHDTRLFREVGSGRIHYCGTHDGGLIESFCNIPGMTGLDIDGLYHDPWLLSGVIPEGIPLLIYLTSIQMERILSGDVPKKKDIIYFPSASCFDEAKAICREVKKFLGTF